MSVNVLERYQATGAYLEGHFLLASGRHSAKFLQSTTVMQYPEHALAFGEALAQKLAPLQPDFVIGPAMGGVVLAFVVAKALGCRALFAEKDGQGGMLIREAFKLKPGETFVAVEDVVTTGASLQKAVAAAERAGTNCIGMACIIDRGLADLSLIALDKLVFPSYLAKDCPLCQAGHKLEEV